MKIIENTIEYLNQLLVVKENEFGDYSESEIELFSKRLFNELMENKKEVNLLNELIKGLEELKTKGET